MHERWPAPSDMLRNSRPSVQVHDDWSVAKPREQCIPFTFAFHTPRGELHVKAQERFTKGLAALERKIAREQKARARARAAA